MAVKITGLPQAIKNIKKDLEKRASDRRLLNAMGQEIVLDIQNTTAKGKSAITGRQFKKYSKSYKETIRGKTSFRTNKQGKTYPVKPALPEDIVTFSGKSSSKPNLSVSLQMLKALTFKVVRSTVEIFTKASRRSRLANQKKDSKVNNQQLSDIVSRDRPYIGISQVALKKITRRIKRFFN